MWHYIPSTSTTDSCRFLPSKESSSRPRVNQFQPAAPLEIFWGTVTAVPAAPLSFRTHCCLRIWVTHVSEPRQEDTLQIALVLYYITLTLKLEPIRKQYYSRYQLISDCLSDTRSHHTKFAGAQNRVRTSCPLNTGSRQMTEWNGEWGRWGGVEPSNYTQVTNTHTSQAAKMNGKGYNEHWHHSHSPPTGIWSHVTRLLCDVSWCDVMWSGNTKGLARVTCFYWLDRTLLFSHGHVQIFCFYLISILIQTCFLSCITAAAARLNSREGAAVHFLENLFCFKRFIMSWRNNIFAALRFEKVITVPRGLQRTV